MPRIISISDDASNPKQKLLVKVGILNKGRQYFTPEQLLTLYRAQLRSCKEYCSLLWDGSTKYQLAALDSVDRRARIIGDELLVNSRLQSLEHRRNASSLTIRLVSALPRLPGAASAPLCMRLVCAECACAALLGAGAALALRVAAVTAPPPAALRSLVTAASSLCKLSPSEGSAAEWSAWAAAAQLLDRVLVGGALLSLFVIVCVFLAGP